MAAPTSLLGNARAFARDFARDKMPADFLWDVEDFVPAVIDANLTSRGPWLWGSDVAGGDFEAGILASFLDGDQLLGQSADGQMNRIDPGTLAVTPLGAVARAKQNPVQINDTVVHFDRDGAVVPSLIDSAGAITAMDATAPKARIGTNWRNYLVTDGGPGEDNIVRFGIPNDLTAAYDPNSFVASSLKVTGLAAIRSVIIVFHAGSAERIRGSVPPRTDQTDDDLVVEPLFGRTGCTDPRSIAYWNENVIFADEHGVHITDGAVVRNLATQGGISYLWRQLYENAQSIAACTFLDNYIITVRRPSLAPVTLICDLNRRQWFRFSNLDAQCYITGGGGTGMERVWGGIAGTARLGRIGPCFSPTFTVDSIDANGQTFLPSFETPWYRLSEEGRKRIRFIYLSYDVRAAAGAPPLAVSYITSPQQGLYTDAGALPDTNAYKRYRLPVSKFPYGVGFRVAATRATTVIRVFDLGVEAFTAERSRV